MSSTAIQMELGNENNKEDEKKKKKKNTTGERDFLMVATTFIAAMAFQAGTNPPGGVWQEDKPKELEAGKSIMATKSPSQFLNFMSGITVCFACSVLQLMVLLMKSHERLTVWTSFMYFTMGTAITSMVVAYWSSVKALTPDTQMSSIIVMLSVSLGFSVVGLPLALYIVRKRVSS